MENTVVINDRIKFQLTDLSIEKLIKILNAYGRNILNCSRCGLTVVPQVNAHYAGTGEEEFKVSCVGCGKEMRVRKYANYGFVIPDEI